VVAVPLIIMPVAFAGGLYLAALLVPRRSGVAAGRAVDFLAGAATTVVALHVFLAIHYATADAFPGVSVADVVASEAVDALWQAGVLVALAALVHLVGRSTPTATPVRTTAAPDES
jgi:hypothetical protein